MLTFCAIRSEAQRIIEVLPDDSFIVEINGKNYRAINADKAREIQKLRVDFDAATKINAEKDIQIEKALLQRDLAQAQAALERQKAESFKADFERAQGDAKRNYGLFLGERTLRQQASEFIPKGQSHGAAAKVLDFLNSKGFQIAVKAIIPPVQTFLAARCTQ